jgi:hypothetical protein
MSPSGLEEGRRKQLIIILSLAKQKFLEVNERDVKMAVATFSSYNIILYVYNFKRAFPSAVLSSKPGDSHVSSYSISLHLIHDSSHRSTVSVKGLIQYSQ